MSPTTPEGLGGRVRQRLHELGEAKLLRTLKTPAGIDLSSNDYLGLSRDPRVVEAMAEAVRREGAGSTGSRLLRGHRDAFDAVEQRVAAMKKADRSLFFSSGYLANLAVLTTLPEAGDLIISDALNHASLIDAIRLSPAERVIVPHRDFTAVREKLQAAKPGQHVFIVTESVFSMDGDLAPLYGYNNLARAHGATLVVDEAHAIGIFGEKGSGMLEAAGIDGNSAISINTAGKALGVGGAFVAGPEWAIEYLIQRARPFVFSTAPPPAMAAAINASLDIVAAEPQRRAVILTRANRLRDGLEARGIKLGPSASQIVPVVVGDNARALAVASALQAQGFDVRPIRPPTVPAGTARLRLSVQYHLADSDLDRLIGALARALEDAPAWSEVSS